MTERLSFHFSLSCIGEGNGNNQSILKEISPEYSLEGLMLKLKLQYFGHLMRRVDSLEKTLMLGGIGGRCSQNGHMLPGRGSHQMMVGSTTELKA